MRNHLKNRAAAPSIMGAAAMVTLLAVQPALAAIAVDVNGRQVQFAGVRPTQVNGRVFIPLRTVAEELGANVRWDAATRTVYGTRGDQSFTLPLSSRTAYVQGNAVTLDAPARMMSGTTMVPLRFVAEALGADVKWNAAMQRVAVNLDGAPVGNGGVGNVGGGNTDVAGGSRLVIPEDTVVRVKLDESLSSRSAEEGQKFQVSLDGEDRSRFPIGTKFEGVVTDVQNATKERPGLIDMSFRRALLPDGTAVAISGSLASLDKDSVRQAADGRLEATKKGKDAKFQPKWVGYGAGAGAVLGAIFGGNVLRGTLIGAAGGAIFGYLDQQKQKKKTFREVDLAEGTEFGVRLNNRVAFNDRDVYRYP